MKITVIATGFDGENSLLLPESQSRNAQTSYRTAQGGTSNATGNDGHSKSSSNDLLEDLDVPTFIRKRVD